MFPKPPSQAGAPSPSLLRDVVQVLLFRLVTAEARLASLPLSHLHSSILRTEARDFVNYIYIFNEVVMCLVTIFKKHLVNSYQE